MCASGDPWANCRTAAFTEAAYHEFTFYFLSQDELVLFERNIGSFAAELDMGHVSNAILAATLEEPKTVKLQSASIWLLAHFIGLQKASRPPSMSLRHLRALYVLLCISSNQIRDCFTGGGSRGSSGARNTQESSQETLPAYVSENLASLIDKDEISGLLERFTT